MTLNPLLTTSSLFDNALDFENITNAHIDEAFEHAFKEAQQNLEDFKNDDSEPNFKNTILRLETLTPQLDVVARYFFNQNHSNQTEYLQKKAEEVLPKLSTFNDQVLFSSEIFKKIKSLFENKKNLSLNDEDLKLLEKTYDYYTKNGADLELESKKRLAEINVKASELSNTFGNHMVEEVKTLHIPVYEESQLEGLPNAIKEMCKTKAKSLNADYPYAISPDGTVSVACLKFLKDRELRKKVYHNYNNLCAFDNENNNLEIAKELLNLRQEQAQLLGFKNYAALSLSDKMAKTTDKVHNLLNQLYKPTYKKAETQYETLKQFAFKQDGIELEAWDLSFYIEELAKKELNFDEEASREYFSLDNTLKAIFLLTKKLFNYDFKENTELPKPHPEARVFEAYENDKYMGLIYFDLFPRDGKSQGAWQTTYREQHHDETGKNVRPHITIVCNFTKPTADQPSLLGLREVQTLFHEFGHAMHSLSSQVQRKGLSGTSVLWDFVELPSQLLENWVIEKEFLKLFAFHYKTGEVIPDAMIEKFSQKKNFMTAIGLLRHIGNSKLDLVLHELESTPEDLKSFEKDLMQKHHISTYDSFRCAGFSHIFNGGYAAGYYGYLWAEVLDADAFEAFKENGILDSNTGTKFKNEILKKGGTLEPEELYQNFRGRQATTEAILKRNGLQ